MSEQGIWISAPDCAGYKHAPDTGDLEAPGGWRDRGYGYDHEHWCPISDDLDGVRIDGVITERFAVRDQVAEPLEPLRRLQALPLPDGRFALIVSGGALDEDDHTTLQALGQELGAATTAVFLHGFEVG